MQSCEEINRAIESLSTAPGRDLGIDRLAVGILEIIESLNAHHVLIAKALLEINTIYHTVQETGAPAMGLITLGTVRELSQMLMKD